MHSLRSPHPDDPCGICFKVSRCSWLCREGGPIICDPCRERALLWAARQSLAAEKSQANLTAMCDDLDEIWDGLTAKGAPDEN